MNDANNDFSRSIGRLEGKVDLVVSSISALQTAFDMMEKGRLSRLEVSFNTLETQVSLRSKNHAFWYAIMASIVASIVSGVILFLLLQHPTIIPSGAGLAH